MMFNFWPFRRKKPPVDYGPRLIPETHLIFTLSADGNASVSLLPRTCSSYQDEDQSGGALVGMHSAIVDGKLDHLLVAAVKESDFHPAIKKKIIKAIDGTYGKSDCVDPLYVFPNS